MKKFLTFIFFNLFLFGITVHADFCDTLNGTKLVANDGTFLGILSTNTFDSDSIANTLGDYGSIFSDTSIFNIFGTYGSRFEDLSPWNNFSDTGPLIIDGNSVLGRMTLNKLSDGSVSPFAVLSCFISNGDDRMDPYWELQESNNNYIYAPRTSKTTTVSVDSYSKVEYNSTSKNEEKEIEVLLKKGDEARADEDYEYAIDNYSKALKKLRSKNGYEDIVNKLEEIINNGKKIIIFEEIETLDAKARKSFQNGDYDKSLKYYGEILNKAEGDKKLENRVRKNIKVVQEKKEIEEKKIEDKWQKEKERKSSLEEREIAKNNLGEKTKVMEIIALKISENENKSKIISLLHNYKNSDKQNVKDMVVYLLYLLEE